MPRSGTLTASKVLLQAYVRGSTIGQVRPMRNPRSSDLSNSSPRSHGGPEVGPQWGCTLPLVRAAAVFPCPGSEWRRIAWPNEVFKEPIHSGLALHASGMGMAIADRRGDLAWLAKARGVTLMKDRQGRCPRFERFPSCEQNLRLRQHRESSLHLGALRVYLRIRVCCQAKPQTPYYGDPVDSHLEGRALPGGADAIHYPSDLGHKNVLRRPPNGVSEGQVPRNRW